MTEGAAAGDGRSPLLRRWAADLRELLGSNFLQNVLGTLSSRAILLVLSVVTAVIVTRALGPEGRGFYAVAVAVSAIGVQVGNVGLHASNTWAVAKDRTLLGALIANSLVASLVIGAAIIAVVLAALAVWPQLAPLEWGLLLLALVSIPIGLTYLLLQNLLLGTGRVRGYNVLEVAGRMVGTVALICLVVAGLITATSAFAVSMVVVGLSGLIAFWLLARDTEATITPRRSLILEHARYGLKAYVAAMVAFLLLRVDILLVQAIRGAEETGYYAVAVSLIDNIYVVPIVVGTLLFARLSGLADMDSGWRIAKTATVVLGILMTICAIVAAMLASPVISFLFGSAFEPSVEPFLWLLPGLALLAVNTPLMNYFAAIGMPWIAIAGPLAGLATNVALNLILIPRWGVTGAALASSIAYGTMLAGSLLYVHRSRHG